MFIYEEESHRRSQANKLLEATVPKDNGEPIGAEKFSNQDRTNEMNELLVKVGTNAASQNAVRFQACNLRSIGEGW